MDIWPIQPVGGGAVCIPPIQPVGGGGGGFPLSGQLNRWMSVVLTNYTHIQ